MSLVEVVVSTTRPRITVHSDDPTVHNLIYRTAQVKLEEDWGNPQYKLRRERFGWDGTIPFYDWNGREEGELGIGLAPWIIGTLEATGREVRVDDQRPPVELFSSAEAVTVHGFDLWEHQRRCVGEAFKAGKHPALNGLLGVWDCATGSGKTGMMSSSLRILGADSGQTRALVVVPRAALVHQTSGAIEGMLQVPVGRWGSGREELEPSIVVATIQAIYQMLLREPELAERVLASFDILKLDEGHHLAGEARQRKGSAPSRYPEGMFAAVVHRCSARVRFLYSGTPLTRSTRQNWEAVSQFGPPVTHVGYDELVAAGILAKPAMIFAGIAAPTYTGAQARKELESLIQALEGNVCKESGLSRTQVTAEIFKAQEQLSKIKGGRWAKAKYQHVYAECLADSPELNSCVALVAAGLVLLGMKVLIIVQMIHHGERLADLLGARFVNGQASGKKQMAAFTEFQELEGGGVLIANKVVDEGIDIPSVNALILAGGGKSYVQVIQELGRGMRRKAGDNRVLVVDCMPLGHQFLEKHAKIRIQEYDLAGIASGAFEVLGTISTRKGEDVADQVMFLVREEFPCNHG